MKILASVAAMLSICFVIGAQNPATNSYTQTNLSADQPGVAAFTDPLLINPWGLSRVVSSTAKENWWWTSDQGTGYSTLYEATGAAAELQVTIPSANGTSAGSPTGTTAIGINFAFATLDGTISEWLASLGPPAPGFSHTSLPPAEICTNCHTSKATLKVNNSALGTSYTGLTVAANGGVSTVYAAGNHGIEAYDTNFNPVTLNPGAFTDPNLPAGYLPFGIQAAGGRIYVTYSPQAGAGGYVDAFDTTGKLLLNLKDGGRFNGPWGIAQAPTNFGAFSRTLLVGNVSSGEILAFNPSTGKFVGALNNASGTPIVNVGLWGLYFGNGGTESGPTNVLYFNAGPSGYSHGLFGAISAN